MDEQKKQVVEDGILFPAGESYIAFDEFFHILQRVKKKWSINIGLPGEFGYGLSEVVGVSSMFVFTTRSEVRGLDLFYNSEQMRLEMQEGGTYDLIDVYPTEKKMHLRKLNQQMSI